MNDRTPANRRRRSLMHLKFTASASLNHLPHAVHIMGSYLWSFSFFAARFLHVISRWPIYSLFCLFSLYITEWVCSEFAEKAHSFVFYTLKYALPISHIPSFYRMLRMFIGYSYNLSCFLLCLLVQSSSLFPAHLVKGEKAWRGLEVFSCFEDNCMGRMLGRGLHGGRPLRAGSCMCPIAKEITGSWRHHYFPLYFPEVCAWPVTVKESGKCLDKVHVVMQSPRFLTRLST